MKKIGFLCKCDDHSVIHEIASYFINVVKPYGIIADYCKNKHLYTNIYWITLVIDRTVATKEDSPFIIWQMDQPGCINYHIISRFNGALNVWEISETGVSDRLKLNIKSFFVPFPIILNNNRNFKDIMSRKNDILFLGIINQRRLNIINELKKLGLSVEYSSNSWFSQKTDLIQKSKICLNIHFYINTTQETLRILESLNWGTCVISESSNDQYNDKFFEGPCVKYIESNLPPAQSAQKIHEKFKEFIVELNNDVVSVAAESILQNNNKMFLDKLFKQIKDIM